MSAAKEKRLGVVHPLGICKTSKTDILNNSFSKLYVYSRCFVECCRAHYVIEMFNLLS
jgi:hypothetical protein